MDIDTLESRQFDAALVAIIAGIVYTKVDGTMDVDDAVDFSVETAVKIAQKAADVFDCTVETA